MTLNKNQFFGLCFALLILPLLIYKLTWIATSTKTTGTVWYIGHGNLGSVLGISTYPVIRFKPGADSSYFNSHVDFNSRIGETLSVRYQKKNPGDACVNSFLCLWGSALIYLMLPVFVLLILYLTPDRFDPLIPHDAKIWLGKKPFIKIITRKTEGHPDPFD